MRDRPRTATRSASAAAWLASAVAVLVLGLLGMHALVASAALTPAHGAGSTSSSTAGEGGALHAQHQEAADVPDHGAPLGVPAVDSAGEHGGAHGGGHDMGGALGMCLAVLAAALALLGLAPAPQGGRPWRVAATFAPLSRPSPAPVHASGPPPTWEFSVIRC